MLRFLISEVPLYTVISVAGVFLSAGNSKVFDFGSLPLISLPSLAISPSIVHLQGYLANKKTPHPPSDPPRTPGIGLR